ncbi:MAG: efflux RND transporter periplasmic adaptor subunit [Caulobacterales bacterium]
MSAEMDRPISRPMFANPRVLAIAGAAMLLALAATTASVILLGGAKSSVRVPANGVTIDAVQDGVFHDFAALRAQVAPKDVNYLDALEGGQVEQVLAHAGDVVVAGQPLVRFRNTQLELDVLDREGRLVESITQLQAYQKQLEDTRLANARDAEQIAYDIIRLTRSAARRDALMAKGYLAPEQRDIVHDELDHDRRLQPLQLESLRREEALRKSQLPQVQAEIASLRESLRITRAKLDDLTVRAPIGGKLTDMDLYIGQIRNRGDRLGQIVPDTGFKLQAPVDEYYLDRVRLGQQGDVELDGRTYPARVSRVDPQVKDANFRVELNFVGPTPPSLLPGQALEGKLSLGGDQRALVLPAGAFLERTGGDWVMVVDAGGGHADRRRIKLGRRNSEQVEVLGGLKAGERVITSDYTGFEKVDRVDLAR